MCTKEAIERTDGQCNSKRLLVPKSAQLLKDICIFLLDCIANSINNLNSSQTKIYIGIMVNEDILKHR